MDTSDYPGNAQQQRIFAVTLFYTDDPHVLAISVFGSLGRGNWDDYSDLGI